MKTTALLFVVALIGSTVIAGEPAPKELDSRQVVELITLVTTRIAPFTLGHARSGLAEFIDSRTRPETVRLATECKIRTEGGKKFTVTANAYRESGSITYVEFLIKEGDVSISDLVSGNTGKRSVIIKGLISDARKEALGFREVMVADGDDHAHYLQRQDGKWTVAKAKGDIPSVQK